MRVHAILAVAVVVTHAQQKSGVEEKAAEAGAMLQHTRLMMEIGGGGEVGGEVGDADAIATDNVIHAEVSGTEAIMDLNEAPMVFKAKAARQRVGPGEDADTLKRLKKALAVAAKDEEDEEGASPDSVAKDGTNVTQVTISPAGEALQAINNASPEDIDYLVEVTYADAIRDALEVFSEEEDVDSAVKNGDVVTASELREINGLTDTPEVSDSPNAVQGDMVGEDKNSTALLQMAVAAGQRWAGTLWPRNTPISYCFVDGTAEKSITGFIRATRHFERLIPCIRFQKTWSGDPNCNIQVKSSGPGCNSYVGKQRNGPTRLNLESPSCTSQGIAAHELGHAIGMAHEQARTDHLQYLTILWDNIKTDMAHNYETSQGADTSIPYDYESLMHYGDTDFAWVSGQKTMIAKAGHEGAVMGNRMGLTGQDAKQVATMYGCGDSVNFKTCTTNPKKSTYGNCVCHTDLVDFSKPRDTKILKITDDYGGQRCQPQCGDYPNNYRPGSCACPQGCKKEQHSTSGKFSTYHACYSEVNGAKTGCRPGSPTSPPRRRASPPRRRATPPRRRWNSAATTKCAWYDTGKCNTDCSCTGWTMSSGAAVGKGQVSMASGGVCYQCGPASCGWDANAASTFSGCKCGYGGTKKTQNCVGGVSCYYCGF